MAAVAVSADNTRLAVATIATDSGGTWGNDGGGGGVADEPDIVYQGSSAQSRKVSTSLIGRQYLHSSAGPDMTAADTSHCILKLNCTNYTALNTRTTPGSELKIGTDASNYHHYYLFGSDNYPVAGGWQIIAVSIGVSGYNTGDSLSDVGTPTDTDIRYVSWLGDYTATAKAENHCIDALDFGRGLKLTGGDGADTDGVFQDFITADEGTSGNRWGYVRTLDGIMFCNGELAIGEDTSEAAVATVFQDATGQVLVWENGLAETGFHAFRVNLGSATTDIDITGATFDSVGMADNDGDRGYTSTEDTRLTLVAVGTSGAANFIGCVMKNMRLATLTSAVTIDDCDVQCEDITQSGAEIFDSIIRTTSATNVAVIDDPSFGTTTDLRDTEFIQDGSGHAIEVTGSATLTNITFTDYSGTPGTNSTPASGSSAAAILNDTGGAVTLTIVGGTVPSVRNGAGATTTVTATVTLTVQANDTDGNGVEGARVRIEETDGTLVSNGTTNASGTYTDATYNYVSDTNVNIIVRLKGYQSFLTTGTIDSGGLTVTATLQDDPAVNLP